MPWSLNEISWSLIWLNHAISLYTVAPDWLFSFITRSDADQVFMTYSWLIQRNCFWLKFHFFMESRRGQTSRFTVFLWWRSHLSFLYVILRIVLSLDFSLIWLPPAWIALWVTMTITTAGWLFWTCGLYKRRDFPACHQFNLKTKSNQFWKQI